MMKAGDIIKHIPTGENLTVVYCDGVEVIPSGDLRWIHVKDCRLISSCTQLEHEECLQKWAKHGTDIRKSRCVMAMEVLA